MSTGSTVAPGAVTWGPGLPPGDPGVDWPVRVAGGIWAPYVYPCAQAKPVIDEIHCSISGFSAEILHYALKAANMSYVIIPQPDPVPSWGGLVDAETGEFDGLLGMIQNGTYDVTLSAWSMSNIRNLHLDYTFPMIQLRQRLGYIMKRPTDDGLSVSSTQLLFRIFTPKVWLAFGGLFLALTVVLFAVRAHSNARGRRRPLEMTNEEAFNSGNTAVWDVIMMAVDQFHGDMGTGRLSGNFVMISIGFLCLFLHTIYEGYLVTMMLKSGGGVPFRGMVDLAELVKKGDYKIATYSMGDIFMIQVQNADSFQYKAMKDALEVNPPWVEPNADTNKILDAIETDSTLVYPGLTELDSLAKLRGRCGLVWMPDLDSSANLYLSLIVQKNSRIGKKLSTAMSGMVSFMVYIGEKYFKYEQKEDSACDRNAGNYQEGQSALQVKHYYGLFFLGSFGVGIAFTAFVGEMVMKKMWAQSPKNTQVKSMGSKQQPIMVEQKSASAVVG